MLVKLEYFVLYRDKELFQVPSYTETWFVFWFDLFFILFFVVDHF